MHARMPVVSLVVLLLSSHMGALSARTCVSFEYILKRTETGEEECCPKCLPGSRVKRDCTEFQSTSCAACEAGTFMDKYNGEKLCFQCLSCTEGTGLREIRSCSTIENAKCEPLEGFFCVSGSVDRCVAAQQHSRCEPGQYIRRAGNSTTDTLCLDCSEGTFSNGTSTSCQVHKECSRYQQPGTSSSDSVCGEGLTAGEKTVIGVVAPILTLIFIGVLFYLYKKRGRFQKVERRETPMDAHVKELLTNSQHTAEPLDVP